MMDKPQIITHIQKSVLHNIFNVKWVPCSAKFVLLGGHSCGSGAISVYELCHTDATPLVEVKKQTAFRCGTFGASSIEDRYFATGDFDGRLEMWNLEDLETPVYSIKAHSKIINAIDGIGGMNSNLGAPEIVTASRDGSVKVWDTRQERLVATMEPAPGDPRQDCWAVAFGQAPGSAEQLVCAGYDNGDIRLFDLRMMSLRWETNIQHGVCCVEFDRKDADMSKLVATTLESKIHVYTMQNHDFKKCTPLVSEKAHKSTVWTVNHLPQDTDVFLTSGGNGSLCLWKHKSPEALSQLQGTTISQQPVTSFDWSPDKKGLSVCTSFDKTVRVLIVTNI